MALNPLLFNTRYYHSQTLTHILPFLYDSKSTLTILTYYYSPVPLAIYHLHSLTLLHLYCYTTIYPIQFSIQLLIQPITNNQYVAVTISLPLLLSCCFLNLFPYPLYSLYCLPFQPLGCTLFSGHISFPFCSQEYEEIGNENCIE